MSSMAASAGAFFAFLRIGAFFVASPFPGRLVPGPLKVILAGGLAIIGWGQAPAESGLPWVRVLLVEIFVGLALGFVLSLCLQAFALAGELGGQQMGLANAGLGNPLAINVNLMGTGYTYLVLAFFVAGDGPGRTLMLLQRSLEILPPGSGGLPATAFATTIVGDPLGSTGLAGMLFGLALHAAAPLVAAAFAAQVVIAVLARTIPNLNWLIEGPSLTISAGTIGLIASLETFDPLVRRATLVHFEAALRALGG